MELCNCLKSSKVEHKSEVGLPRNFDLILLISSCFEYAPNYALFKWYKHIIANCYKYLLRSIEEV